MIAHRTKRLDRVSTRSILRAFQHARGISMDPGLFADLELLRHKDLDLSIKAGALLAFDGLILTASLNPMQASPGAPLSLNALTALGPTLLCMTGAVLIAAAAAYCVGAILIGEDFDDHGLEDDPKAIVQRMFAAYCAAIDAQALRVARAITLTYVGGAVTGVALFWSLFDKWM
jgi:hypothetical protein